MSAPTVRITPDGTRISDPVSGNTFRAAADSLKWKRRDCFAPRPIAGEKWPRRVNPVICTIIADEIQDTSPTTQTTRNQVLSWAFGFSLGAADGGRLISESDGRELWKMFEACPMIDAMVYAA